MRSFITFITMLMHVVIAPFAAFGATVEVAQGVYVDGNTLYISADVTSLPDLQLNPSDIYCYAATPPACSENTFSGYDGTLHVPRSAMVAYISATYWKNFVHFSIDAIEPESVTISTETALMETGDQLTLTATVTPADATPNEVTWTSTNAQVATVVNGRVTAKGSGECDIIASCFDKRAVCHVKVISHTTIYLLTHEVNIKPRQTANVSLYCSVWTDLVVTSSNPEVARATFVESNKIAVEGISEGTAIIKVNSADGLATPDSCIVKVYTVTGDVNADGDVNIGDVTALIDYLLSNDSSSISLTNADTNNDASVNISDVTILIDYLLTGKWPMPQDASLTFIVNDIPFTMRLVKAGTFTMGATEEQLEDAHAYEQPAHEVTITRDYYMCETEVTIELWKAVMGTFPSIWGNTDLCPVNNVSWNLCQEFITRLNELTGQNFRLPTEAEWEFAARGGNSSLGYKYSGSNDINEVAWYSDNSDIGGSTTTHPVGLKKANELGLYDMCGNVHEWCQDYFGNYSSDNQTDPAGPTSGTERVARGGGFDSIAKNCRVSTRRRFNPAYGLIIGLRIAL